MSVIAVRVTQYQVEMAADSATSYNDVRVSRAISLADQKLWASNGMMVAFVGMTSLGSILRRWTRENAPEGADEASICQYVDRFHAWRREMFPDSGDIDDVAFVLAYQGTAWVVDGYSVSAVTRGGYFAHGSGMSVALGALHCGGSTVDAVTAACQHNDSCGLPVVVGVMEGASIVGSIEFLQDTQGPRLMESA